MPRNLPTTENLLTDTGVSSTDNITSDATLTGNSSGKSVITFAADGPDIGTTRAGPSGHYMFAPPQLPDGTHTVVATADTGETAALTFTLDTTRPPLTEALANDTAGNNTTTDPTLTGTAE